MIEPMQDGLRDALRRLKEDAAGQGAPAALEGQLTEAFRRRHRKSLQRKWLLVPAAIAASVAIGFVLQISEHGKVEHGAAPVAVKPAPPTPVEEPGTVTPVVVQKEKPRAKTRPARVPSRHLSVASAKPRESVEEQPFVQIPYAPPFTTYDEGQILRVNMKGSSIRRMGIPVAAQQVQADLLVGNDGLPRAVRLVSHSPNTY
jgi:hypothetical protein